MVLIPPYWYRCQYLYQTEILTNTDTRLMIHCTLGILDLGGVIFCWFPQFRCKCGQSLCFGGLSWDIVCGWNFQYCRSNIYYDIFRYFINILIMSSNKNNITNISNIPFCGIILGSTGSTLGPVLCVTKTQNISKNIMSLSLIGWNIQYLRISTNHNWWFIPISILTWHAYWYRYQVYSQMIYLVLVSVSETYQ